MVMVTRSARRKASESFGSDISQNNIIPPWCSSGKLYERKPRKLATPSWEIRSSYPLRENIWEYLHDDKNFSYKRKKAVRKQTPVQNKGWGKTVALLAFLFVVAGVMLFLWMSNAIPETNLVKKVVPRRHLVALLGLDETSVDAECCSRMKYLAAALLRAEEALRSTLRQRKTLMLTEHTIYMDSQSTERDHIEGATATKGSGTKEWGGRVALWGVVPLWRASPPPDTVLASRKPAPSDCWPLSGSFGELIINLPRKMAVRSVSIEHIRPDTARSAPKRFELYGILENSTWIKAVEGEYRHKGPAKQFYLLHFRNVPMQRVIFRVLSNQGNLQYTCVYRVHLYGGFSD